MYKLLYDMYMLAISQNSGMTEILRLFQFNVEIEVSGR